MSIACAAGVSAYVYHSDGVRGVIGINLSLFTPREVSWTLQCIMPRLAGGLPPLLGALDVDACRKCCPGTHMSWHGEESAERRLIVALAVM